MQKVVHKPRQYEVFIIYKPFGMLSQFSREQVDGVALDHPTLADLDYRFSKDVYPVGRLDSDSEGLLLLTNDKSLNTKLLDPKNKHPRTYWVQVEGIPTETAIRQLQQGVDIRIEGKVHHTLPAVVTLLEEAPDLPERQPAVRFRKSVPDRWLEITLTEGKNRQVRRMCAAVGFPVLRLVRAKIGSFGLGIGGLGKMTPGEIRLIGEQELIFVTKTI